MKKYQNYKSSGIEWIGEIPQHWNITKLNRFVFFQEGSGLRTFQFTEDGIKVICVTNITESGIDFSYKKFISTEEYLNKYQHFTVNKGDFLLSSSGNSWGKVSEYLDDEKVILNTSTIRLNTINSKKYYKDLIKYVLKSEFVRIQLDILMTGSCQPNFGPTHLNQIVLPIQLPDEQQQIVQFLNEKTEIIDKLISTKERKIELLKQQRTSLINHVITKGLDPTVKMKDSGVEWIGKIPEHWKLVYLRHYTEKVGSGITPKGGSEIYVEEGINFIRSQNVHFDGLRLDDVVNISLEIYNKMSSSKVQINDVLLNITGGSIGRCCVVNLDKVVQCKSACLYSETKKQVISNFLELLSAIFNRSNANRVLHFWGK